MKNELAILKVFEAKQFYYNKTKLNDNIFLFNSIDIEVEEGNVQNIFEDIISNLKNEQIFTDLSYPMIIDYRHRMIFYFFIKENSLRIEDFNYRL